MGGKGRMQGEFKAWNRTEESEELRRRRELIFKSILPDCPKFIKKVGLSFTKTGFDKCMWCKWWDYSDECKSK
jgi:hypothetical protein